MPEGGLKGPDMSDRNKQERDVLLGFAERVDRNDPGALNNLGVLYYRKGVYEDAIKQFKEALKIDPRFELARENLLYLFSETNLEDPDVSKWKKEVEEDPANEEALLRLGVSYQNMGRFDEASEILGKVAGKNPDHYMARIHLGSVLKAQGFYQQALEHFLSAADDVSKSAVFHTDLGEIYYNLGKTDEAISELRTAIKIDAEYWRSHFLLSFAFGDLGHYQEALEESRVASKLNPSFQNTEANLALSDDDGENGRSPGQDIPSLESTAFTLGTAYRERGYFKEALKEFRKALQDMPEKDRVYIEMGKLYLAEKDGAEALAFLLKALEANSDNPEAYLLCGTIYHEAGEHRKAGVCYLQAFRLNSADAETMNDLGVLLYQVGLVEEAERMFKKGLNINLYNLELNYNYLTSILFREEYPMAENLLQRLEAFTGKSAILYEKRALLHYKLNRMTLALFDIESALACDKHHADAHYLKGLICLREDNFKGAIHSMLEGAAVYPEYTGMHFLISQGEQVTVDAVRVDSKIIGEPDDELIELLQAGVSRRFDKIRESLESFIADGKKDLERMKAGAASSKAVPAAAKQAESETPAVEPAAGKDENTKENEAADPEKKSGVKKIEDMVVTDVDDCVDLLEDLKIDL
jgi:tetratricopeptide (TPR) repeat protein